MKDGRFEWDNAKATLSETKHGISFAYARLVFDDARGLDFADLRREYGEHRWKFVGYTPDGLCLVVVFTERGERVRIISARRASKRERMGYAAKTKGADEGGNAPGADAAADDGGGDRGGGS